MTDTTPLSSAARSMLNAVFPVYDEEALYIVSAEKHAGMIAAAALRAVAKQSTFADTRVGVTEEVVIVDDILKIATELEQW
jgi:hypothetical protein